VDILVAIVFVMGLIAVVDIVWSRFHWRRDLRMTKQEVKDELKQSEGDPIVKSRLRSLARDRARRRMMTAVPRATLVIANPTHYSIALK
ncbi:MAG: flagellar biosynthesis protein FlhB, partial [Mesorhizobium sp.]